MGLRVVVCALLLASCGGTGSDVSGVELADRVVAGMVREGSVRIAVGNETPPADYRIDYEIGTGDFGLEVPTYGAGIPPLELRRVGETAYFTDGEDPWQRIVATDPRIVDDGGTGIVPEGFALDVLADLEATFAESTDLRAVGEDKIDGVSVDRYEMTLDPDVLVRPSWITLVETSGAIEVVAWIGEDGLPVRIEYDIDPGTITRLEFSRWGEPVVVDVPEVG